MYFHKTFKRTKKIGKHIFFNSSENAKLSELLKNIKLFIFFPTNPKDYHTNLKKRQPYRRFLLLVREQKQRIFQE